MRMMVRVTVTRVGLESIVSMRHVQQHVLGGVSVTNSCNCVPAIVDLQVCVRVCVCVCVCDTHHTLSFSTGKDCSLSEDVTHWKEVDVVTSLGKFYVCGVPSSSG